jgi:hypothetical protein
MSNWSEGKHKARAFKRTAVATDWTARYVTTMTDLVWLAAAFEEDPEAPQEEQRIDVEIQKDILQWIITAFNLAYIWEDCDNQQTFDKWIRDLKELWFDDSYVPGDPAGCETAAVQ